MYFCPMMSLICSAFSTTVCPQNTILYILSIRTRLPLLSSALYLISLLCTTDPIPPGAGKPNPPDTPDRVPGFTIGTNQLHSINFFAHSSCSVHTSISLIHQNNQNDPGQTHRRRPRAAINPHTSISNSNNITTPHLHHNTTHPRRRILRNPSTPHAHALPRKNTLDRSAHQIP